MEQLRAELSKRVNDASSNASNIMEEEVSNANEAMEVSDDSMPVADDSSRVTPTNTTQTAVSQALNIAERALNSATGTFWLGEVSRKWTGERLFGADQVTDYNADVRVAADDRLSCTNWVLLQPYSIRPKEFEELLSWKGGAWLLLLRPRHPKIP
jgi:hypothetical protein